MHNAWAGLGRAMKFHLQAPAANLVTASGPGWIRVGATEGRLDAPAPEASGEPEAPGPVLPL